MNHYFKSDIKFMLNSHLEFIIYCLLQCKYKRNVAIKLLISILISFLFLFLLSFLFLVIKFRGVVFVKLNDSEQLIR